MAVIRCPSCGKPNPDFLDTCQYCDTPLHGPAVPGSAAATPKAAPPAAPAEGDSEPDLFANLRAAPSFSEEEAEALPVSELPDWLSRLGGPEAAPAQPANQPDETAGKISSWLDNLRKAEPEDQADSRDWYWTGTQGEADAPAPQAAAPAEGLPDWLKSMDTAAPDQAAPATRIDDAGLPDWLQGISTATTAQPQPAQPAAASPFGAAPAEELPDWLQGVSTAVPAAQPQPPAQPTAAPSPFGAAPVEELPDWLQGLGANTRAEPAPTQPAAASPFGAEPAEALPDWMQRLGATPSGQTETSQPAAPLAAAAPMAAEALFAAESQIEASPATADEMPDWMQSIGSTAAKQPVGGQPASPIAAEPPLAGEKPIAIVATAGDELPDWLRTAGTASSTGEEVLALGEVPDWLQSFDLAIPEQPAQPAVAPLPPATPPEATPVAGDELPDWLRSIGTGAMAPAERPPAEARPTAWLGTPGAIQSGPAIIAPDTSAEEQPEWLRALGVSPSLPEAEAAASPTGTADEQPEWLRSLGITPPVAGQPTSIPSEEPSAGVEQPEWLRGLSTAATIPAGEALRGAISPFGAGEASMPETPSDQLPEWLAHISPAKPSSQPAAVSGARLAPVALPSWLEAMRPIDIQRPPITPEVDDFEETVGVLAGLRGVLRAQSGAEQLGKSATLVHKLEVTEAQTKQANLLARTLAEAFEAHPASKRNFWLALPVARLAVFAVLFLAFVTPLIFPEARNYFTPAPSWSLSAQDTFNILDNLSPAKPALVVFDYDPAQAGELDPLAQSLIAHLQRRSVPITGLSTSPAGAATGEMLLNQIFKPDAYGSQYVNLGYLPGGPAGILQMTNGLRPLLPVDFRGNPAVWETAVLTHTQQLSDFGVIVLVSATPDTVRAWVEQLQSYTSKPELIAAVSAGAEPLVRPYYDNADPAQRQLKGLVSGILGAAQYERQSGVAGVASGEMWDMLGWGLVVVIVLLIGGNLFYGLAGVLRRQKR